MLHLPKSLRKPGFFMGQPLLISDLAEKMTPIAGLRVRNNNHPHGDIEIDVIGQRPGEAQDEQRARTLLFDMVSSSA
ncbi:polysaccharide biosynthesis protein [Rhodopseudomonas pseudopalustris]|uniref:Polysaccharide biosynthesis protein n=1 Tax=Rhodopseudomonas pseudopalustris TaxID=1513892 RepID=A0A1H8XD19_9BRAD|nr:polysaccharide biosynthesis protein [Rhodopseudomonas pseudopalustris]SEP37691.1 Polysaccharide biosynthesis protein [Rhodopseudomonas pseudopalustris]